MEGPFILEFSSFSRFHFSRIGLAPPVEVLVTLPSVEEAVRARKERSRHMGV